MIVFISFKTNTKTAKHFKIVMLLLFFLENKIFWRKSQITVLGMAIFSVMEKIQFLALLTPCIPILICIWCVL